MNGYDDIVHDISTSLDSSGATPPETWEERFESFWSTPGTISSHEEMMKEGFKDFIRAEKEKSKEEAESSAYERVVEVLEGMKGKVGFSPTLEENESMTPAGKGYQAALSEAISKIKELKGKI